MHTQKWMLIFKPAVIPDRCWTQVLLLWMFSLNLIQKHLVHQGWTLSSALRQIPGTCNFCYNYVQPCAEPPAHFQGSMWGADPALQNNKAVITGNPEICQVCSKGSGWEERCFERTKTNLKSQTLNIVMPKNKNGNILKSDWILSMPGAAIVEVLILSFVRGRIFNNKKQYW